LGTPPENAELSRSNGYVSTPYKKNRLIAGFLRS